MWTIAIETKLPMIETKIILMVKKHSAWVCPFKMHDLISYPYDYNIYRK